MEEIVSSFNGLDMKKELCSKSPVSCLHKLEIESNYDCGDLFHFYASLKQRVTMLEETYLIFIQA